MTCNGRWEDVFGSRRAGQRMQQGDGSAVKRDNPGFAGLGQRHQQRLFLPVHMIPFGLGDLIAPGSGEQQEHDGFGRKLVVVHVDRGNEALGLLGGEEPLPMDLGGRGETCGRVHACTIWTN